MRKALFLILIIIFLSACGVTTGLPLDSAPLTWLLQGSHPVRGIEDCDTYYRIEWQSPRGVWLKTNILKNKVTISGNSTIDFSWIDTKDAGSVQELFDKYVESVRIN